MKKTNLGRRVWTGLLALMMALSLVSFPLQAEEPQASNWLSGAIDKLFADPDDEAETELLKLRTILALVEDNYYEELTDAELIQAMYAGMMDRLGSKYTFYLSPEENEEVEESMSGEYSGIGALISMQDEQYVIADIFDDSPAAEAGLRIGDIFTAVDGIPIDEFSDVSLIAAHVRGEEGTPVELTVWRPWEKKELTFEVIRGSIQNANLHYEMLEDGIGYVRIVQFNSGVSDNFREAVDALKEEGAKTVIFDLRNNGGGYVYEVTKMLDYLLPPCTIAEARGRYAGQNFVEPWLSEHEAKVPEDWHYPVLINKYSASASELFSGCLRDYGKATLIGEKSFGKGVGTITQKLKDGSAVQITNFHYYLPEGDCVQDVGLEPHVKVELPEEVRGLPISQLEPEEDTQLARAIELAKSGERPEYEEKEEDGDKDESLDAGAEGEEVLERARECLNLTFDHCSRQGLLDYLTSEYGEGFDAEAAEWAVKTLEEAGEVDWDEQARESARGYLESAGYSKDGLIDQLSSECGAGFTLEQAKAAVLALEEDGTADWDAEAREAVRDWLGYCGCSKEGLIEQLSGEYGEGFPRELAVEAVETVAEEDKVDWDEQALRAARERLEVNACSRQGLIEELSGEFSAGFSEEAAERAVARLEEEDGIDWKEQAVLVAEDYLEMEEDVSREELLEQLTSEYGEGFTEEEAEYAADMVFD